MGVVVDELKAKVSSTQFIDYCTLLDKMNWEQPDRTCYYLAQVAAEIRQFREGFTDKPRPVSTKDFILPFGTVEVSGEFHRAPGKPAAAEGVQYEVGPQLVQDPKWAEVNARAKGHYAAIFGVHSLEELKDGRAAT